MQHHLRAALCFCAALLVSGCGGGGGAAVPQAPAAPVHAQAVATIALTIPKSASTSVHRAYVSPNTASVRLHVISVNGGAPNPSIADVVANVTANSNGCASSAAGVTCTLSMTLPGGSNVLLQITTYDAINGGGNVLSSASSVNVATSAAHPSVSVSLGGIVSTVVSSAGQFSAPQDAATHTIAMNVSARDASGATIIAPGSYATPISLNVANDPNAAISLSQSTISAPGAANGQTAITITYDATKTVSDAQIIANGTKIADITPFSYTPQTLSNLTVGGSTQTVTVSEALNSSAFTATGFGTLVTVSCAPASCAPATPGGAVTMTITPKAGGTGSIAIGDALSSAQGQVAITVTGPTTGNITVPVYSMYEYAAPTALAEISSMVAGPDGHSVYFSEGPNQKIGVVFTNTCVDGTPPNGTCSMGDQALGTGYNTAQVAAGPDGDIYAVSNGNNVVEQIAANTCGTAAVLTCTHQPTPGVSPGPQALAFDRDATLYVGDANTGSDAVNVVNVEPCCSVPSAAAVGGTAAFGGMTQAADGTIWFTLPAANQIGQITCTPFCSATLHSVTGVSGMTSILGTPDGSLWIAVPTSAVNTIYRISPASCSSACSVNGTATLPTSNSYVASLAYGPDGNVWFTESNAGKVGFVSAATCVNTCSVREFLVPSGASAGPVAITAGPDGNIWFGEFATGKLGKVVL